MINMSFDNFFRVKTSVALFISFENSRKYGQEMVRDWYLYLDTHVIDHAPITWLRRSRHIKWYIYGVALW